MKLKTALTFTAVLVAFSVVIGVVDVFFFEDYRLFWYVFGLTVFVGPIAVLATFLLGTRDIVSTVSSNKVSKAEKQDVGKRLVIALVVGGVGLGLFWLIQTIGTALIDL